jgi:hypothetical protein
VLLLHTTVMADSDADAVALLAALQGGPLAGRELGHVQDRTSVLEENAAQTAQNPEGYRYAVDCTWTDAPARVLAPMLHALWSELDTEHSFSIWYGWAPRPDRPDMAFSVEGNVYVAAVADLAAARSWLGDVFGLMPELSLRVDAVDLSIEMLLHPTLGYRLEVLHRPPDASPCQSCRTSGHIRTVRRSAWTWRARPA